MNYVINRLDELSLHHSPDGTASVVPTVLVYASTVNDSVIIHVSQKLEAVLYCFALCSYFHRPYQGFSSTFFIYLHLIQFRSIAVFSIPFAVFAYLQLSSLCSVQF